MNNDIGGMKEPGSFSGFYHHHKRVYFLWYFGSVSISIQVNARILTVSSPTSPYRFRQTAKQFVGD